jgi:hypothetical protein
MLLEPYLLLSYLKKKTTYERIRVTLLALMNCVFFDSTPLKHLIYNDMNRFEESYSITRKTD